MKRILALLVVGFMVLGAKLAMADVRADALNVDPQYIDDVDLIWLYPNLVTQYKNMFDVRTNYLNSNTTWGGFIDGEHTGLGTVAAYAFRPYGYQGQLGWNNNEPGWFGTGFGWNGSWNNAGRWTAAPGTGHINVTNPENKLDLIWGDSMDKGNIGIHINYADAQPNGGDPNGITQNRNIANSAANSNQVTASDDARVLGVNVGLGLTDLGPFAAGNVHAGFSLGSLSYDDKGTNTGANTPVNEQSVKDNGIYSAMIGAIMKNNLDENSDVRAFADVYLDQNNQTEAFTHDATGNGLHNEAGDTDAEFTSKYNDIIADLGLGCNHKVLDGKATVGTGVGLWWANSDQKLGGTTQNGTATTTTYVPQNAGPSAFDEQTRDDMDWNWNAHVEAQVASWLTLRSGLTRPIIWRTTTVTTVNTYDPSGNGAVVSSVKTTNTRDAWFGGNFGTYSLGFGINWENWQLDADAQVGDVYQSIGNVSPGNGLLFDNGIGNNNGNTGTLFAA